MHLNEKRKEKLNWVSYGIVKFNNSIKVTLFRLMWKNISNNYYYISKTISWKYSLDIKI